MNLGLDRRTFIEGMGATLVGFWNRDEDKETPAGITGIRVTDVRADRPQFKRRYVAQISAQVSMKIEMRTSYGGSRYSSGELDQSNGRWVLFEAERPADKILDRELLPTIQKFCEEILALDRAYIRSDPSEFVDEAGVRWARALPK